MIVSYLLEKYQYAILKIEQFTERKNWKIELTFFIPFLILFFSFPSYEWMFDESMSNWKYILEKAEHPFINNHPPNSHQAKLTFRFFIPMLAHIFHLNAIGIIILQIITGFLLVYLFIKSILQITNSKIVTVLLTIAFSSVAICKSSFLDILGYLDSFAIFFLIIPFVSNNPLLIFGSVFFASWIDERGLIASCFIFIWIFFIKKIKKLEVIALLLAWLLYFIIRFSLAYKYNLVTHSDDLGLVVLMNQLNNVPIGIWSGLEGFWVLILFSIIVLIKQKKKLIAFCFLGSVCLVAIVALSVIDITRSMIYLFPSIFIALSIITKVETEKNLINISAFVLILCALFPALTVGGYNSVNWQYPLPLQLLRYLTNFLMS